MQAYIGIAVFLVSQVVVQVAIAQSAAVQATSQNSDVTESNHSKFSADSKKCVNDLGPSIVTNGRRIDPTVLDVTIGADGSVRAVTIAQSSGDKALDENAANCAMASWHFKPLAGQAAELTKQFAVRWQFAR